MAKKSKKEKYPVILVEAPKKKKCETELEFRLRVLQELYCPPYYVDDYPPHYFDD